MRYTSTALEYRCTGVLASCKKRCYQVHSVCSILQYLHPVQQLCAGLWGAESVMGVTGMMCGLGLARGSSSARGAAAPVADLAHVYRQLALPCKLVLSVAHHYIELVHCVAHHYIKLVHCVVHRYIKLTY
jgi:hypothetical protein